MTNYLDIWTKSESAAEDAISVKRVYIDICGGNLIDGVLFSQIMYWHGIGKNGKRRLQVFKDGHWWLAKKYEAWETECRINARTARAAINRMCKAGLLEKKTYHFGGVPIAHIRIVPEKFQALIEASMNDKPSLMCQEMSNANDIKCQNQVAGNVTSYTETTTETTTDILSDATAPDAPTDDKPKRKRSAKQQELDAMCEALVAAFGLDREKVTSSKWSEFRRAGRELLDVGATPASMKPLHEWCKRKGWDNFSSVAMAKEYAAFAIARAKTTLKPEAATTSSATARAALLGGG